LLNIPFELIERDIFEDTLPIVRMFPDSLRFHVLVLIIQTLYFFHFFKDQPLISFTRNQK